jgi:hypothetical protein
MLKRPSILAPLFAIAATAGLSLMAAPAGYASAPVGLHLIETAGPACVKANPSHGGAGIQLVEDRHQPGNRAQLRSLRALGNGNYHIQNYGNGLCVRTTSKDNAAVWA